MELKTFYDEFELMAEAPNGIQKLREMVLQLAVQGKLVSQNPNDEPASLALNKIVTEKKRLIKEKLIRNEKPLPPLGLNDIPFEIPASWEWTRIGNLCSTITQGPNPKYDGIEENSYRVIKTKDFYDNIIHYENADKISSELFNNLKKHQLLTGDIIFGLVGRGSTGKCNVFIEQPNKNYIFTRATGLIRLAALDALFPKYVKMFFSSSIGKKFSSDLEDGSTGQIVIKTSLLKKLPFPLPPTTEQQRIATKVDELMALCDNLEVRKQKTHQACIKLNESSINKLLMAPSPQKFDKHWNRIQSNFDLLYSKPENVTKLRQAILQLAVQGKLVPQDPNDEPASLLLDRAKSEKKRLEKKYKVRKSKTQPNLQIHDHPYIAPDGWEWTRIGHFALVQGGKRLPKGASFAPRPTPFIYIRVTDMKGGTVLDDDLKFIDVEVHRKISRYTISKKDIYITIAGTIGSVGRVPELFNGMNLTENAAKIVFREIDKKFLFLTLNSSLLQEQFVNKTKQLAQPKLALHRISSSMLPIPPINEQKRIVAKVDLLMALCDDLEGKLSQGQSDSSRLVEAVVADLLAA